MQTTHNPIANPFSAGMSQQPSIIFPVHYAPGTTDNFVSNETVAKGISAQQIWALLHDISKWESYYKNCAQITVPDEGPQLEKGRVFKFSTFGFPPLTCTVRESVEPGKGPRGSEGRLAWESKTPEGLEDVSKFPDLIAELLRQGVSDEDVAKIAGRNLLRVWSEADKVANELQKYMLPLEDDVLNRW